MTNDPVAAALVWIPVLSGVVAACMLPPQVFPDDPLKAGVLVAVILVATLVYCLLGLLILFLRRLERQAVRDRERQRQQQLAATHRQAASLLHTTGRTTRHHIDLAEQQLYRDAMAIIERRKR